MQDPSKHNDVDAIFDQARQLGAVQGPFENIRPSSSSTSFTGVGRTLTGETVPPTAPQPPATVVHNIVFWRNGFTINDGPLRRLDDPENAPFLEVTVLKNESNSSALQPNKQQNLNSVSLAGVLYTNFPLGFILPSVIFCFIYEQFLLVILHLFDIVLCFL